jgi:hypothetical protein
LPIFGLNLFMRNIFSACIGLSLLSAAAYSQADSTKADSTHKLTFSGYVESYYAYTIGMTPDPIARPYFFNYTRQNEFAVNLALLRLNYADNNIRGNLGLMTGNYAEYNLSAEPVVLRNIYEAYAGVRVSKYGWIDVGVFPSHIGCEGAIGKDNLNLSRSLIAENSPYYEAGIRYTYQKNEKWLFHLLLLNGWQNIRETNGDKAFGWHVAYKPTKKFSIYSCGFAGNEKADTAKQYRVFHDLNFNFSPSDKFTFIGAFDVGMEQKAEGDTTSGDWNLWHGASLQAKIAPWKKVSIGLRLEEYWDKYGIIIGKISQNGFQTTGCSVNIDVIPYKNVVWRTEFRYLNSVDDVFLKTGYKPTHVNTTAISSLMISF